MKKQCINCRYGRSKPTYNCACYPNVKLGSEVVVMKYNNENMQYCDGFKPEFKGRK